MNNLTIIIPTTGKKKFINYLKLNINNFLKYKIEVIVITSKKFKIKKQKKLKIFFDTKSITSNQKLYLGLKYTKTKNVFFAREDELINILSFRKMYYRFLKNKLVSIQGIKLLAIKNNNQIYPHNPDLFCKNQNFNISSFLTKIKIALYYAPECYWTFHKKKVVYLFLNNYLKNDLFNSPALYDYYFIYFIMSFGTIEFIDMPISLKIKQKKRKAGIKFENHKRDKNFTKSIEFLTNLISIKKKISRIAVKKAILFSLDERMKRPKPRNIIRDSNLSKKLFYKSRQLLFRLDSKINRKFISHYDIYKNTKLNNQVYKNISSQEKELKYMFTKLV